MRFLSAFILVSCALAQNGSQFKDWPSGEPAPDGPKAVCAGLRGLTSYEFSVITAELVRAGAGAPEHCRVTGQILPEIRFQVNLPSAWNRRLYMFGNGGYAGESLDTPGRINSRAKAMIAGFAVADMNTGHDAASEPLGSFAVNRQKLIDYSFRSLHVTAETAKKIVQAYYGGAPSRSYFEGCSTGGRQALILAQRFPADFDGIVVGAPVLNFSGTMMSYVHMARALAAAPVPEAKLKLLAERVYANCDAIDGLKDGLIDDPRRCGFSPDRDLPKCEGDADAATCFTAGQIRSIQAIYSDVMSQGKRIFPGWPVGAEIAGPNGSSGWVPWIARDKGRTIGAAFGETFFRYLAFPEKDPSYDISRFDFDKDPPRLAAIHEMLDATDTDLSAFRSRGGKMLMYYGWADPALNARMGVEYYEQVSERMGPSTQEFYRLFMVPGMFHCSGGVGAGSFDAITPLVQWVERAKVPERITGTQLIQGKPLRTRPLCPYPQVARYKGSGSVDDAANFACVKP